jgi:hypothetical protein
MVLGGLAAMIFDQLQAFRLQLNEQIAQVKENKKMIVFGYDCLTICNYLTYYAGSRILTCSL